ncbi:MAG: ribonuclease H-like domain-containing protein [Deltaproteobacteria bacterium]|nr:ribonuclease H-like domain-containing protein [Candidatus Zymogenaceae bacterium]
MPNEYAYLDIETTFRGAVTVVGVYREPGRLVQLVGEWITAHTLEEVLGSVETVVTYNGNRFDLPVIKRRVGLDIRKNHRSRDLMYDCHRMGLFGGLKAVERTLGIERETAGLTGRDAPVLWERYRKRSDQEALALLLRYNGEDVVNLAVLRRIIDADDGTRVITGSIPSK